MFRKMISAYSGEKNASETCKVVATMLLFNINNKSSQVAFTQEFCLNMMGLQFAFCIFIKKMNTCKRANINKNVKKSEKSIDVHNDVVTYPPKIFLIAATVS